MFIFTSRTKDVLEEMEDKFIEEQVGVRAGYGKDDHISTCMRSYKMFCGK